MAKILVVDDSKFARYRLEQVLEKGGHEIVGSAGNGLEAVELFKTTRPDVVTLDYVMSDISGAEVLRQLIEMDSSACVVVISGAGDETLEQRMLNAGAAAFVEKFNPQLDILHIVEKALAGRS